MEWEEMKKFLGFQAFLFYPPMSPTVPWFQWLSIPFSLCHILNNFFRSRFQFSSSLLNCICILLSCLSIEFLMSVIIIFLFPLGFVQASQVVCIMSSKPMCLGVLLEDFFPFIPLHSGVNPRRQHPHLPTVGQHFSTLPFRDSIFVHGGQNRVPSFLSQACLHQQMSLGPVSIPSLRDFSLFLTWEVSFIFLTVQLCILKEAFNASMLNIINM